MKSLLFVLAFSCPPLNDVMKEGLKTVVSYVTFGKADQLKGLGIPVSPEKVFKFSRLESDHRQIYKDLYEKYGAFKILFSLGTDLLKLLPAEPILPMAAAPGECVYDITLQPLYGKESKEYKKLAAALPEMVNVYPLNLTKFKVFGRLEEVSKKN